MQTFLPYPDFIKSAKVLDYRRLGKQRVEAMQLINAIEHDSGWKNHPACKMWSGCLEALKEYHNVMISEWISRGYRNTMPLLDCSNIVYPSWLGRESFHASHRSNLLRKDPTWYGQFGWTETSNLPYEWPV